MNLNELFPKQQKLDDYIKKEKELEGQDLLSRKIVALICELYECVNEGRWFKFWSDDTSPKGKVFVSCESKDADFYKCGVCHKTYDDRNELPKDGYGDEYCPNSKCNT